VAEFLALRRNPGRTVFFREIERVEPGHIVTATTQRVACEGSGNRDGRRFASSRRRLCGALRSHLDTAGGAGLRARAAWSAAISAAASTARRGPRPRAGCWRRPAGGSRPFTSGAREGYDGFSSHQQIGDEGRWRPPPPRSIRTWSTCLVRASARSPLRDLGSQLSFLYDQPILNI